jgi:hypothetical protein
MACSAFVFLCGEQRQYTIPVIFRIVSSVNSIILGRVVSFSIWLVLSTSRGHSIKLNQNTENVNFAVIGGQALMGIYECMFNVCVYVCRFSACLPRRYSIKQNEVYLITRNRSTCLQTKIPFAFFPARTGRGVYITKFLLSNFLYSLLG